MTLKQTLLLCGLLAGLLLRAQDSIDVTLPSSYIVTITNRMDVLESKLNQKSRKALHDFQKSEAIIYKKVRRSDSLLAKEYLRYSSQQYAQLKENLSGQKELTQYVPRLDTLKTLFRFLDEKNQSSGNTIRESAQVKEVMEQMRQLEASLAQAEQIEQFIKQRRAQVIEQLSHLPLGIELKKINKQVYYYSAQLKEYKQLLKDRRKMERKALELVTKHAAFRKFFARNSQFASLFRVPEDGSGTVSLEGLQTRAAVQQMVTSKVGNGGAHFLQTQLKTAQKAAGGHQQVPALHLAMKKKKSKSDFTPNTQKTKPFLKRLEYGTNVQFGKVNQLLPTTADLAFSLGYKLNDDGSVGVGSSYKLGLGTGIGHIRFSSQGYTLRSFLDWKLRGNLYITGGYELLNLVKLPSNTTYPIQQWQESGLVGASKKYVISHRLKGNLQLLFDFLSYNSIPKRQPVIFRTGWNF